MKKFALLAAIAASLAAIAAQVAPFTPVDGAAFKVSQGGKLVRVESFSPVSGGTLALKSIWSTDVYTNALDILTATNMSYTVVESNAYTHVVTTNVFPNLSFENDPGIVSVATNAIVTVTTNKWPVFEKTVAVTNAIVSGTQTGFVFTNTLQNAVYLAPGEHLLFTGTAVGGFVRLIFE